MKLLGKKKKNPYYLTVIVLVGINKDSKIELCGLFSNSFADYIELDNKMYH